MEPLSFLLVFVSAVAAYFTKNLINGVAKQVRNYHARADILHQADMLEIRTADGDRTTIDAEKLTREKATEIVESHSAAHAAF